MAKIAGTYGSGLYGQGPYGGFQPGQEGYMGGDAAYIFTPPVIYERHSAHPLFGRMKTAIGVTVLKEGGFYRQVREVSQEDIDGADIVYLGGHDYEIPAVEAASLEVAGYGAFIRNLPAPPAPDPDLSEKW